MGQCWAAFTLRCEQHCSCFAVSRGHNRYTEFAPQDKEKYSDEKLLNQLQGTTEADAAFTELSGRTYSHHDDEAGFESTGHETGRGRQRVGSVDSTDGEHGVPTTDRDPGHMEQPDGRRKKSEAVREVDGTANDLQKEDGDDEGDAVDGECVDDCLILDAQESSMHLTVD